MIEYSYLQVFKCILNYVFNLLDDFMMLEVKESNGIPVRGLMTSSKMWPYEQQW